MLPPPQCSLFCKEDNFEKLRVIFTSTFSILNMDYVDAKSSVKKHNRKLYKAAPFVNLSVKVTPHCLVCEILNCLPA